MEIVGITCRVHTRSDHDSFMFIQSHSLISEGEVSVSLEVPYKNGYCACELELDRHNIFSLTCA